MSLRIRNKEYDKEYNSLPEVKENKRQWYLKNKERILKKQKENYDINPDKYLNKNKVWRDNNSDKVKENKKQYSVDNRDRLQKYRKNYYYNRYQTNTQYRISSCISSSMKQHLRYNGVSKNGRHWEDLVGYTVQELKNHLESLFTEGMTWDNQGRIDGIKCWEIDHIIPKSFFIYTSTDDVEFRYCWSLDNLQPLWAEDNISKGDKL